MIVYASRTGTRRNLATMHAAGWRQLVAPGQRPTHARGFMLDNGAWSAHRTGGDFDGVRFARLLQTWGRQADHVVAPDVVAGGLDSLALSISWLWQCLVQCRRVLVPVQDGMEPAHLVAALAERGPRLGDRVGIFVGGSTTWKLETLPMWGAVARAHRCWLHVGRVNSARRIQLCRDAGADSIDGTSGTVYAETVPLVDGAARQLALLRPEVRP